MPASSGVARLEDRHTAGTSTHHRHARTTRDGRFPKDRHTASRTADYDSGGGRLAPPVGRDGILRGAAQKKRGKKRGVLLCGLM